MSKGLIFFCCSCCILLLTTVNLSIGPIISGTVGYWGTLNCKRTKDNYDIAKDNAKAAGIELDDKTKKGHEIQIDRCERRKGMHDMEYTAFIFDIVIGFVCGLIGLLHLFDLKKDFVSKTGLIGLCCGIVGFVLTFVYVIFNGIVFTNDYSGTYKRDGDGVFAEKNESTGKYKCLYYDDSGDTYSIYAKYSELNKKQYNYKKDFYKDIDGDCIATDYNYNYEFQCAYSSEITIATIPSTCKYAYTSEIESITNKDIFDRFMTTLILSLIVCLANIGLALFGFLLFRTPGDF